MLRMTYPLNLGIPLLRRRTFASVLALLVMVPLATPQARPVNYSAPVGVIPPMPSEPVPHARPGQIWQPGFYSFDGQGYAWHAGQWLPLSPSHGIGNDGKRGMDLWVPSRWVPCKVQGKTFYTFQAGHWFDPREPYGPGTYIPRFQEPEPDDSYFPF